MKLYECPRNTRVKLLEEPLPPPPGGISVKQGETIMFHHIDGMYSYCTNNVGDVVHVRAWTDVELAT